MAQRPQIESPANGNGNGNGKYARILYSVERLGLPTVAVLILLYLIVTQWLQPQNERMQAQWEQEREERKSEVVQRELLIKTMSDTYSRLGDAVETMEESQRKQIAALEGINAQIRVNGDLIRAQSDTTVAVNRMMNEAQKLMEPVPAMREEQIDLTKQMLKLLESRSLAVGQPDG